MYKFRFVLPKNPTKAEIAFFLGQMVVEAIIIAAVSVFIFS